MTAVLLVPGVVVGAFVVVLYATTLLDRLTLLPVAASAPPLAALREVAVAVAEDLTVWPAASNTSTLRSTQRRGTHVHRIGNRRVDPRRHRPVHDDART
ncbi:MAG: hypothetical protein QOH79_3637 [Acidimicrobiaceae bacterium]